MTRLQGRLPTIDYLGRDYDTIVRDLAAFIKARRSDDVNSFFEGDIPKLFIELIAYIGDMLSYAIDRAGEEAFLNTCRLFDTALRHAAVVGYPVATIKPASAFLVPTSFADIPAELTQSVSASEVQTLTLTPGGAPSGTFTLSIGGETTAPITYGASIADEIEDALETLPAIGEGNVAVTGPVANVYTITFRAAKAYTPMAQVTVDATLLTDVTAATATVTEGVNNSLVVVFRKGTQVQGGGLTWEVSEDTSIDGITINASNYATLFRVPVVEGKSSIETFISDGSAFQQFTTDAENVIDDSLDIRVGDPDGDKWTLVESIALADDDDKAYAVRYNSKGQATITFGDGRTGMIPPEGQVIYVNLRVGNGERGNVGAGVISTSLTGFADSGGSTVQKSVPMTNVEAANGGRERETIDEIRRNVPAWIRTADRATTKEDYDTLGGQYDGANVGAVARAAAYLASGTILQQTSGDPITPAMPLVVPKGTDIVIGGYTFTTTRELRVEEADPILFFNPNTVYVYLWARGVTGFEGASSTLLAAVREYLQERSVITTTIFCIAGRQKIINVNLGTVVYNPAYTPTDMRTRIIDAVRALFVSDLIQPGEAFRLSDLYNIVENVAGVEHFVIVAPTTDTTMRKDEIAVLGTLDFTLTPKVIPFDQDANRAAFDNEIFN